MDVETSGGIYYKEWEDSGVGVGVKMGGGIGRYLGKEVGGLRICRVYTTMENNGLN